MPRQRPLANVSRLRRPMATVADLDCSADGLVVGVHDFVGSGGKSSRGPVLTSDLVRSAASSCVPLCVSCRRVCVSCVGYACRAWCAWSWGAYALVPRIVADADCFVDVLTVE